MSIAEKHKRVLGPNNSLDKKEVRAFFTKSIAIHNDWVVDYYRWMGDNCEEVYGMFFEISGRNPTSEEAKDFGIKIYALDKLIDRMEDMSNDESVAMAIADLEKYMNTAPPK